MRERQQSICSTGKCCVKTEIPEYYGSMEEEYPTLPPATGSFPEKVVPICVERLAVRQELRGESASPMQKWKTRAVSGEQWRVGVLKFLS